MLNLLQDAKYGARLCNCGWRAARAYTVTPEAGRITRSSSLKEVNRRKTPLRKPTWHAYLLVKSELSLFFINYIEFIYFPFMSVFFKLHPEASMRAGSIKSFWFKMIWFLMCIDLLFSCYDFANLIVQGSLRYLAKIPHFEPKHTLFQKYFPSAWFLNT